MVLVRVTLYADEGLTCDGCNKKITNEDAYLLLTDDGQEVDLIYCEACKPTDD